MVPAGGRRDGRAGERSQGRCDLGGACVDQEVGRGIDPGGGWRAHLQLVGRLRGRAHGRRHRLQQISPTRTAPRCCGDEVRSPCRTDSAACDSAGNYQIGAGRVSACRPTSAGPTWAARSRGSSRSPQRARRAARRYPWAARFGATCQAEPDWFGTLTGRAGVARRPAGAHPALRQGRVLAWAHNGHRRGGRHRPGGQTSVQRTMPAASRTSRSAPAGRWAPAARYALSWARVGGARVRCIRVSLAVTSHLRPDRYPGGACRIVGSTALMDARRARTCTR